jgi:hypothetical protein
MSIWEHKKIFTPSPLNLSKEEQQMRTENRMIENTYQFDKEIDICLIFLESQSIKHSHIKRQYIEMDNKSIKIKIDYSTTLGYLGHLRELIPHHKYNDYVKMCMLGEEEINTIPKNIIIPTNFLAID